MRLVEQAPAAVGYLLKERIGRVDELTDALHRVAAGECVVDRMVVQELFEHTRRQAPLAELSPRERQILQLMAEGRSNQGIREQLWLSPKTVETHIRSLFNKLGLRDAPESNRRVLAVLAYLSSSADQEAADDEDHVADEVPEPERALVTILSPISSTRRRKRRRSATAPGHRSSRSATPSSGGSSLGTRARRSTRQATASS